MHTGFTGHEHDPEHGLINMKGRIYDPELGRFTTADPFVQAPFFSQSLNRYAYVFNNPLRYVDPSGFLGQECDGVCPGANTDTTERAGEDDTSMTADEPTSETDNKNGGFLLDNLEKVKGKEPRQVSHEQSRQTVDRTAITLSSDHRDGSGYGERFRGSTAGPRGGSVDQKSRQGGWECPARILVSRFAYRRRPRVRGDRGRRWRYSQADSGGSHRSCPKSLWD